MLSADAIAEIETLTALTPDDLVGLQALAASPTDLAIALSLYRGVATFSDRRAWERVVAILATVAQFVPLAQGIAGLIGTVVQIAKAP